MLDLVAGGCSKESGALRFRNVEGVLDVVVLNAGSRRVETTAPAYKEWRGQGRRWAVEGPYDIGYLQMRVRSRKKAYKWPRCAARWMAREKSCHSDAAERRTIREAGQFDDNTFTPGVKVRKEGLARKVAGPRPTKCRGAILNACAGCGSLEVTLHPFNAACKGHLDDAISALG